jgi:peptidoglycan/xylan/chitin deacetylase (PgdA/CDA1 family)
MRAAPGVAGVDRHGQVADRQDRVIRSRPGGLLMVGGLVAAAAYWAFLSPSSQLVGVFPARGTAGKGEVALTFDDGPNEPFTSQIGTFLAAQGIVATFFQVGKCVDKFPETSRLLLSQGHVLANHSYSHSVMRCLTPGSQRRETLRTQQLLTDATGRRPALYRPPWLLRTPSLLRILRELGLQPVSGTFCHPWEVFQPDARRIARRVLATTRPGSIIIFHDGFDARGGNRSQTAAAVPLVVAGLKSRGYTFLPVHELLGLRAYH